MPPLNSPPPVYINSLPPEEQYRIACEPEKSMVRLPGARIGRIQAFIDLRNAAFITLKGRQMITFEV
jgi:hypothetical protein